MKQFMSLLAVAFAMVLNINAAGFPMSALHYIDKEVPVTVENGDTVGARDAGVRNAAPAADTTTQYNISLHPFEGVPRFNPAFVGLAANAITAVRANGELSMGSPTGLSDPRLINHITYESLMTTPAGVTYWAGFNPTGAFAGANGKTVWVLVRVKSKIGANDVSLSTVSAALRSQDFGNNSLGLDVGFISNSYTALAPGWRADGGMVTSGSSSQMVAELMVVVGFKSYEVTNASGVAAVQSYVAGNFTITFTATAGASSKTLTLSLIPPTPRLFIHKMGSTIHIGAETNGNTGTTYVVKRATSITGPWTPTSTTLASGQTATVPMTAEHEFFSLQP